MPALRAATSSNAIPVEIRACDMERLAAPVEAALYFCCMEAVVNATKHSGAAGVVVSILNVSERTCGLAVTDDGTGFEQARIQAGMGLVNMRDRLDSIGGSVTVKTVLGGGTTVSAVVPRQHAVRRPSGELVPISGKDS